MTLAEFVTECWVVSPEWARESIKQGAVFADCAHRKGPPYDRVKDPDFPVEVGDFIRFWDRSCTVR